MENLHEDPTVLVRTYAAELTPGDGRTADVRIVKYGERCTAADGGGGLPVGVAYQEEWAPGAFAHQYGAAHRVTANCEHEPGVQGIVGRGLALRDEHDALYGTFTFLKTPNGDTALELVREGVYDGVSMEFRPARSRRLKDGAIQRVKAHLRAIAFCTTPAYESSRVLALRAAGADEHEFMIDDELVAPKIDPALLERVQRLGLRLPAAYRPADASTEQ